MTINVAYLCGEYPRATDTFIQREVAELRSAGAHVETISVRKPVSRERGSQEQEAERARTQYLLPCSPLRLIVVHLTLFVTAPMRYLRTAWAAVTVRSPGLRALCYQVFYFAEAGLVAARLKRQQITHLHNHAPDSSGYVTMLAAGLADCTYSLTLHGFGILTEPSRWRLREKLHGALFVVCISQFARGQAMLWSDRKYWPNYHVIHCGVDPTNYELRQHSGQGRRLLFVGRLDAVKGLSILLEAVSRLSDRGVDLHLDIVGDGPQRDEMSDFANELQLSSRVTFHGYLSQHEMRSQLAECDVMVLTSLYEGIPVVLMEGMAAGLPVVAPRITGIPELVEDGVSGYLTASADVGELVDRLEKLLGSGELRSQFGAAGRHKVETDFNLPHEVRRLSTLMFRRLNNVPAPLLPEPEPIDAHEPASASTAASPS